MWLGGHCVRSKHGCSGNKLEGSDLQLLLSLKDCQGLHTTTRVTQTGQNKEEIRGVA